MSISHRTWYRKGLRDGIPIGLGYFAVALAIGITARNAGLTAPQATITSLLIHASAGEYIGITLMAARAGLLEIILMEGVANARYLLMSCSLSQKIAADTPLWKRLLLGFTITDEIFGISVSVDGKLDPWYSFGAMTVALPSWAAGTCCGVLLGNVLPAAVVTALSVGLYGMFMAIFMPAARKNPVILGLIGVSFAASYAMNQMSVFSGISSGFRIILLTVVISLAAAVLFPVKEDDHAV